jgi:hypothetical protein
MSYISDEKRDTTETNQRGTSIWASYAGVSGGLSSQDKSALRRSLSTHVDLQMLESHQSTVLLQTGQREIVSAWSECMRGHGGGPTVYFINVPSNPNRVNFHIENQAGNGFKGADLKLARDVRMHPEFKILSRADCLAEGYSLKWGAGCTVEVETQSPLSSDLITVPLVDEGGREIDFEAYLAPRIKSIREIKNWPTAEQTSQWQKAKAAPNVSGVNKIHWHYGGKDNDNRALMATNMNDNCAPALDGFIFLEGEMTPNPNNKNIQITQFIHVEATGMWTLCSVNWRITPDSRNLCVGGVLGSGNDPNPHDCNVSTGATMSRVSWCALPLNPADADDNGCSKSVR